MPELSGPLTLTNGIALVGADLRAVPFRRLIVVDDQITQIDEMEDAAPDSVRAVDIVDLGGAYLLPGLIDAHVHFDLAAEPAAYTRWSDPRAVLTRSLTCLHNGLVALSRGITGARDLGSVDGLVIDYAWAVERGRLVGPRIAAAGRPITITGGHCADYGRTASGVDDVREAVREQVALGATVIKIMASGGISTPGNPTKAQFTDPEMAAAVDEAHRLGLQIAAHAHAPAAIRAAVEAGVDSIEHAGFADDETVALMVEHGCTLVPTVTALNNISEGVGIPALTVAKSLAARETYRANTRRAIQGGVRIAAGTDAGTALNPLGDLVDELDMYVERGLSEAAALCAATVHAGRLIGQGVGVLEVGAKADLVVVATDPRAGLDTLRRPLQVVSHGRLVPLSWVAETIDRLAAAVAE